MLYDRFESFDVRSLRRTRGSGRILATTLVAPPAMRPTALAVTTTGGLGWLDNSVLHATDADGTRVLAGPSGDPITSLRAHGAKVLWTQGVQRLSATLR